MQERQQNYLVVVVDVATTDWTRGKPPLSSDHVVAASSAAEAEDKAVAQNNESNGYGAEEDGGFIAIHAYTRDELQAFLNEMDDTFDSDQPLIQSDAGGWPPWCPNCGNRDTEHPSIIWEVQEDGLECVGCGCLQRWSTVERRRERLDIEKTERGARFQMWLEQEYEAAVNGIYSNGD